MIPLKMLSRSEATNSTSLATYPTLDGSKTQYAALDEAIRIVQFIRNKCLRVWMDERGISKGSSPKEVSLLAVKARGF